MTIVGESPSPSPGEKVLEVIGGIGGVGRLATIPGSSTRAEVVRVRAHLALLSAHTESEPAEVVERMGGKWSPEVPSSPSVDELRTAADTLSFASTFLLLCRNQRPDAMRSALDFARRTLELTNFDLPLANYMVSTIGALDPTFDSVASYDQTAAESTFADFEAGYASMEPPVYITTGHGDIVLLPRDVVSGMAEAIMQPYPYKSGLSE
jgi:hypothetical protein